MAVSAHHRYRATALMAAAATRASVAHDLADVAYSHALAIVGDTATAERVALAGLRRGGRSRTLVLAHCRHVGLTLAPAPDRDGFAATGDLPTLARQLAFSRPAVERCIVDLDARLGVDRARLARVLGLPPAAAAARAAEVQLAWERELDPVVLAAMGPGQCMTLAEILAAADLWPGEEGDEPPPVTVAALAAAGPDVAEHAAGCSLCGDRLRAMVSVRTLLAQQPQEPAPAAVRAAVARLRSPTAPPALGQTSNVATRQRLVRLVVAIAALVLVGALMLRFADSSDDDEGAAPGPPVGSTSTDLVLAAAATALPTQATLRNDGDEAISWTTASDTEWVVASPRTGTLEPGERVRLRIAADTVRAPEGQSRPTITVTGDDGSAAVARFDVVIETKPDVAAALTGCTVTASVEDDSEIADVTLTYAGGRVAMEQTESGWSADLPAGAGQWSVTAVDARGNEASTPVEPTGC